MSSFRCTFGILLTLFLGCGGGSGSSFNPDILENGLLGSQRGDVTLTENGCAEYRDIPVTQIGFGHLISAQIVEADRLNITFKDYGYVCNALNFDRYWGRFDANCGIQPLNNFLPGYRCTQELVWSYSEPTTGAEGSTADVVRTCVCSVQPRRYPQFCLCG